MSSWVLNGSQAVAIAIDSRGLQYGDGLFETIAIRNGNPRLWDNHVDRLQAGCARLDLECPDLDACHELIVSNSRDRGTAKIVVAARPGQRGYGRSSRSTDVMVRVFENEPLPADFYRAGIVTTVCNTRLAVGSPVAGLKTLNRIEQVLARNEPGIAECFEGIMCDIDGNVICGTMSNVFAIRDNVIFTPSLDRCGVAGVMRRHVIDTLRVTGHTIKKSAVEFDNADELFVCNSQFGVLPVRQCDAWSWPVGPVTSGIADTLANHGVVENGA